MSFIRKTTKLALIPAGIAVTVFNEVREELREKTPEERKEQAEAKYLDELSEIELDEEIAKAERELMRRTGNMPVKTRKERKLAELKRELAKTE